MSPGTVGRLIQAVFDTPTLFAAVYLRISRWDEIHVTVFISTFNGNLARERIQREHALRIGLVNKVTTPEELMPTAKAMAGRIMQKGLFAVQMAKVAINNGLNTDLETGSVLEATLFGVTCATEDKKEGMTAFVEKRKPVFPGK